MAEITNISRLCALLVILPLWANNHINQEHDLPDGSRLQKIRECGYLGIYEVSVITTSKNRRKRHGYQHTPLSLLLIHFE